MRVFVDTNILVFLYTGNEDLISVNVRAIITEWDNEVMTSTVCVQEFIHLLQTGRVCADKRRKRNGAESLLEWLHAMNVRITPVSERDLGTYSTLPLFSDHFVI